MKIQLLFFALFLGASLYGASLQIGTYSLSGGSGNWGNGTYIGEVVIAPQGENYRVVWRIGTKQSQIGIGILQGNILSVAFTDTLNPSFWGVASYRIGPSGELEGKWTSSNGAVCHSEHLLWKNRFIR